MELRDANPVSSGAESDERERQPRSGMRAAPSRTPSGCMPAVMSKPPPPPRTAPS